MEKTTFQRRDYKSRASVEQENKIKGVGIVYNSLSENLISGGYSYREKFAPGSLSFTDVVILFEHTNTMPLGRQSSGNVTITDTATELRFIVEPVATSYSADVIALVRSGVVTGCSVGFFIEEADFDEFESVLVITKARLQEISLTAFPAYPQTTAELRSFKKQKSRDIGTLQRRLLYYGLSQPNQ